MEDAKYFELIHTIDDARDALVALGSRQRLRAQMAATVLSGMLARKHFEERSIVVCTAVAYADDLLAELGL